MPSAGWVALLPLILLTTPAMPTGPRPGPGFGTAVMATDPDAALLLLPGPLHALGFADDDSDGWRDANETVYWSSDGARVAAFDVRLSKGGTQVAAASPEVQKPLLPLQRGWRFVDRNRDGDFGRDEPVVLAAGTTLAETDLMLTPSGLAPPTATDLRRPTRTLPGEPAFLDVGGDGRYGAGDEPFLAADPDGLVSEGDLPLSSAPFQFSVRMDAAFAAPLLSPSRLSQPVFVDHDGDGVFDPEESAFLSASPGVVREGDAHLGKWSSALRVCPGDGDFGRATTPLQAAWGFLDASGDGMSPNDTVVLDADGSGTLTRGDLPLRSAPVAEGDPRAGLALLPLDARVAHWDHGGAERDADLLYLDRGATGHAGPGDIRLWPRSFGQPLTGWRDESLPALAVLPGLPTVPSFAGERAYLAHGASVVPGDVRLTRSADGEPGTAVLADDADVGLALARAGGAWAFLDSDHDGRYGAHDAAHLDADRSGTASAGDLVVSGPQAGQRLDASAVPVPLVPFDAAPAALDGDGDGAFSGRDLVVLDAAGPGEGLLTAADVRLSASRLQEEPRVTDPYPSSPRTCASPPEASATSPPPGPSSSASSSAPAVPSSGPEGTAAPPHSAPAPALPWAPLAAAVALAAALRRRR